MKNKEQYIRVLDEFIPSKKKQVKFLREFFKINRTFTPITASMLIRLIDIKKNKKCEFNENDKISIRKAFPQISDQEAYDIFNSL